MKTETHPFDGVGDNSQFSNKIENRESNPKLYKWVEVALRRKHQKSLIPTTSNKNELINVKCWYRKMNTIFSDF